MKHASILALALATLFAVPASAHVTLERKEANPGRGYKAVLAVPHGCKGSPTTKVTVTIPEGVIAVKPQPKPGWSVQVVKGAYAKAYDFMHGIKFSEGVKEISWTGKLDDGFYDEFVFAGFIANTLSADTTLYFPVTQECEVGKEVWIEIPAAGQNAHALNAPAPSLRLVAAAGSRPAASFKAGTIVVETPWLRATPRGARVAGGYMKITNTGTEPDRLVSGALDQAGRFEVHEMSMDGGVMKMRELTGGLVIEPGKSVELKPGGLHIMGQDLKVQYTEGQKISGTLVFEKAGPVKIEYTVGAIGGGAPGGGEHDHH